MALVCIGIMLVSVNIIAAQYPAARLDLTAEKLYTLSPGTRATLARIGEPITLRFYYSSRLGGVIPAYGVYAQRVRELLDQYVAESRGKLRLEAFNPEPFSDVEDRAVAAGLQAVPLNSQGEQVYFGLAGTNSTDDQQTIPFFAPERERFLEYDLTRLVHTLAFPKRTVVGLMSGLPLEASPAPNAPARPLAFLDQLRQLDDVETLPTTLDAIPAGTDVVMLVQPQNLPQQTLFAIDQFVLRGGKAIVFVDPYSELQARTSHPASGAASDLPALFKAWGLRLLPDTVAADRKDARRVVVPAPGGQGEGQPMDYIAWLDLRGGDINHNDVITANLSQVAMATAGILEPLKDATSKFEPLITTTTEAEKLPTSQVAAALPDVAGLLSRFHSANSRFVLAAHITGDVGSAFPEGRPKPAEASAQPAATSPPPPAAPEGDVLRKSVQPANIVVIADTDMLDDKFWARTEDFYGQRVVVPVANNADLVANAVEVLAGGRELVDLRSRGSSVRPFDLVQQIQQAADDRYAAEQKALERKLQETQAKLRDLTAGEKPNAPASLSPEQARAVEQFRVDMLNVRRELRSVQAALRQDIERLKAILEFFDIALVPIIVAAAAIVLGSLRMRRWRAALRRRQEQAVYSGVS
ncbi:MAG: GldG family protein [Alphaproteobacteria bacterium]|nr:GldG family protein [Alphaproteobacteria bacterium]